MENKIIQKIAMMFIMTCSIILLLTTPGCTDMFEHRAIYKIEHWYETVSKGAATGQFQKNLSECDETELCVGIAGKKICCVPKNVSGFEVFKVEEKIISEDGNACAKIFYKRKKILLEIDPFENCTENEKIKIEAFFGEDIQSELEKNKDLIEKPVWEGHDFVIWDEEIPVVMPNEDTKINGIWDDFEICSITFMLDEKTVYKKFFGAVGTPISNAIKNIGAPFAMGKTFEKWNTEIPNFFCEKDLIITAIWEKTIYTAFFMSDSKTLHAKLFGVAGQKIPIKNVLPPQKNGHTFAGWKNAPEFFPARDVVINAEWIANDLNIIVNILDADFDIENLQWQKNEDGSFNFFAEKGHASYEWLFDGTIISNENSCVLNIPKEKLLCGAHRVTVFVDKKYSSTFSITIKK